MIRYTESLQGISPNQLAGFFVGWLRPPSPDTHWLLLQCSAQVVLAVDDEIGRVVGFVNALSDGVLNAFIPLLEVLPEYQGRGIGRELMRRMLARLDQLYAIDLVCDTGVQPFYEKLGMQPAVAMLQRNYQQQAGAAGVVNDD